MVNSVDLNEPHHLDLHRDYQRDREQQALLKSINSKKEEIPVWDQLATDQFDPWQVVPRQVFTLYSRLLISTAFVVASRVGCLGVTGVYTPYLLFFQLTLLVLIYSQRWKVLFYDKICLVPV